MRSMRATEKGYIAGRIVEPGETIPWPHENTPYWLEEVKAKAAAPAAAPAEPEGESLDEMTKVELVKFARENDIDIDAGAKKDVVLAAIKAALGREAFGPAPAPSTVEPAGNGLQAAFGGIQPDWVPQAAQPAGD